MSHSGVGSPEVAVQAVVQTVPQHMVRLLRRRTRQGVLIATENGVTRDKKAARGGAPIA